MEKSFRVSVTLGLDAFALPGLPRKRRNAFSIEKAICHWQRGEHVVQTCRVYVYLSVHTYIRM